MDLTTPQARTLASGIAPGVRPAGPSPKGSKALVRSGMVLALFLGSLLLPISLDLVGLRLSPYRILLMAMILPFIFRLMSGAGGRLTWVDGGILGFALWIVVTLVYHHGIERLPYAVILAIESFGGYLAGRLLIRSAADYRRFIRYFLICLLVLLPFAIHELLTSRMLISEILRPLFEVTRKNIEFRFGLSRVQVVFPHSILYGLFCSLALGSVFYIYRGRLLDLLPRAALVIGMTLMSLSSAPMLSVALQLFMILWDKMTRGSWKVLAGLSAFAYVFLQTFSNRGAIVFFIETFTLTPQTGWWRIYIWQYGIAAVKQHPFLGIGLNDWYRPDWLTSSVDNFWLLITMRHGLPAILMLGLAIVLHAALILRARPADAGTRAIRTGYAITLAGLLFVLSTVFVWNEVATFIMFFLGAGAFLYTAADPVPAPSDDAQELLSESSGTSLRFSRFPQTPGADRRSRQPTLSRLPGKTKSS